MIRKAVSESEVLFDALRVMVAPSLFVNASVEFGVMTCKIVERLLN